MLLRRGSAFVLALALVMSNIGPMEISANRIGNVNGEEKELLNPVLYYGLDEKDGNTVNDLSGNDYHGTLRGNATFTKGLTDGGVKLPGGKDFVSVPTEAFNHDEISLSFWVKLDEIVNWTTLVSFGSDKENYMVFAAKGAPYGRPCGITVAIKEKGKPECRIKSDTISVPVDKWALVTYVQSGTNASIYLNGEVVAESNSMNSSMKGVISSSSNVTAQFGASHIWPDPNTKGKIDELKIYDKVISVESDRLQVEEKQQEIIREQLEEAKDKLDLGDLNNVEKDLNLPNTIGDDINIQWLSSNEKYVTNEGKVTIPNNEDGDQIVTLTAILSNNKITQTVTKDFQVYLKALSKEELFEKAVDYTYRYLDTIVNDGQTQLPLVAPNGSRVEWSVSKGNAEIRDNIIHKIDGAAENEPIELMAKVIYENLETSVKVDKLILKDAYVANIMSYFTNRDDRRGMKLSYSYDCKNFMPLNGGKAVIKPTIGSKRMRDPSLFRKNDGSIGVVSTQGWDNPAIYFYDTDLTEFTNERLIPVAATDGTTSGEQELTNTRAWAPEVSYDRITSQYYVYWSDPKTPYNDGIQNRPIYYNTSTDLINFSEPGAYMEVGSRMIDASIVKDDGIYYLVYKGEENPDKKVYIATSDRLDPESFKTTKKVISEPGKSVEGPTLARSYQDGKWYLYYDYFTEHGIGYAWTDNIKDENSWQYVRYAGDTMAPSKVTGLDSADSLVSHCGLLSVTQKELDRAIEKWGVTSEIDNIKYSILKASETQGLQWMKVLKLKA